MLLNKLQKLFMTAIQSLLCFNFATQCLWLHGLTSWLWASFPVYIATAVAQFFNLKMSEIWCLHANRKTCLEWHFSPCNNQTGCLSAVNAALPRSADYQSTCSSPCLIVFPRSCFHLQFHGWLLTMQGFLLACLFLPFLGNPCLLWELQHWIVHFWPVKYMFFSWTIIVQSQILITAFSFVGVCAV